jgi:hypothetical protein
LVQLAAIVCYRPITVDLTTFAYLLDDVGNVGYVPMTAWQSNRVLVDRQILPLPIDLAPGKYRLVVGWYYPITGDRLLVTTYG